MRIIGTRLGEVRKAVREWKNSEDGFYSEDELNRNPQQGGTTRRHSQVPWNLFMQILVSVAILSTGLYVILQGAYSAETQKWAAGLVGSVVGYWMS